MKSLDADAVVSAESDIARLIVSGIGMRTHTGVARRMFGALAERNINIGMINTSEIRISVVVDRSRGEERETVRKCISLNIKGLAEYAHETKSMGVFPQAIVATNCRALENGEFTKTLFGHHYRLATLRTGNVAVLGKGREDHVFKGLAVTLWRSKGLRRTSVPSSLPLVYPAELPIGKHTSGSRVRFAWPSLLRGGVNILNSKSSRSA